MGDLKPTNKQIELYKELRKITEAYHMYSDQIMAIAKHIDEQYIHKVETSDVIKNTFEEAYEKWRNTKDDSEFGIWLFAKSKDTY